MVAKGERVGEGYIGSLGLTDANYYIIYVYTHTHTHTHTHITDDCTPETNTAL